MIGLVVVDEIHTCTDNSDRAVKLELLINFILILQQNIQKEEQKTFRILAMSATLDNATDFSSWLKAELF